MPHAPSIPVCFWKVVVTVVLLVPLIRGQAAEPDAEEGVIAVRLIVSDREILVGDSLGYKLIITNRLDSTVQLSDLKNPRAFEIKQFVECRKQGVEEWSMVRENSPSREGMRESNVQVAPQQNYAIHDQIFIDKNQEWVFATPGVYEVRIRLSCVLGEFPTKPVTLPVGERPAADLARLHKGRLYLQRCLHPLKEFSYHKMTMDDFRAKATGGGLKRSLDLLARIETFQQTGLVDGKSVTFVEAYEQLGQGLDEVRREQLAAKFIRVACREKNWEALALLLEDFKEDSQFRRSYSGALRQGLKVISRPGDGPKGE